MDLQWLKTLDVTRRFIKRKRMIRPFDLYGFNKPATSIVFVRDRGRLSKPFTTT